MDLQAKTKNLSRGKRWLIPSSLSWCKCSLYHTKQQEGLSSPAPVGFASKTFWVSWYFVPSSLEVWPIPFFVSEQILGGKITGDRDLPVIMVHDAHNGS